MVIIINICGDVDITVINISGDVVDIVLVINHLRYLQALESCDLKKLITNVGSGVGAAPAAGGRLFPNFYLEQLWPFKILMLAWRPKFWRLLSRDPEVIAI